MAYEIQAMEGGMRILAPVQRHLKGDTPNLPCITAQFKGGQGKNAIYVKRFILRAMGGRGAAI